MRPGLHVLRSFRHSHFGDRPIGPLPHPSIFPPICDQSLPYWILQNVFHLRVQTFRRPKHVVKRFFLPYNSTPPHLLVDCACGRPFDRLHDPDQGKDLLPVFVNEWGKDHVDVIGHDDCGIEFVSFTMVMAARCKYEISRRGRQYPSEFCDKRDEMRGEVSLKVRQITAIELHNKDSGTQEKQGAHRTAEKSEFRSHVGNS